MVRRIRGDSMSPALKPGHLVIGTSYYAVLRLGDVVIVHHGGLEKIKRVHLISKDYLFLLGDNEAQSTDSRSFGWLHVSAVRAKVVWPRRR
jgi:phage repressor protein C with HTH and peptisase S24 domain